MARCHYGGVWDFDARNISLENMIPSEAGVLQEAGGKAREVVDMALLHGWLQVADYGALLGLLLSPTQCRCQMGGRRWAAMACTWSWCAAHTQTAEHMYLLQLSNGCQVS